MIQVGQDSLKRLTKHAEPLRKISDDNTDKDKRVEKHKPHEKDKTEK